MRFGEAQESDMDDGAVKPNTNGWDVPFRDAVMVALPEEENPPAVTWNETVVWLARTFTDAGTVRAAAALLANVTVAPPAGAAFESVTVQVAECPAVRAPGEHCKVCTPGEVVKVRVTDIEDPLVAALTVPVRSVEKLPATA